MGTVSAPEGTEISLRTAPAPASVPRARTGIPLLPLPPAPRPPPPFCMGVPTPRPSSRPRGAVGPEIVWQQMAPEASRPRSAPEKRHRRFGFIPSVCPEIREDGIDFPQPRMTAEAPLKPAAAAPAWGVRPHAGSPSSVGCVSARHPGQGGLRRRGIPRPPPHPAPAPRAAGFPTLKFAFEKKSDLVQRRERNKRGGRTLHCRER